MNSFRISRVQHQSPSGEVVRDCHRDLIIARFQRQREGAILQRASRVGIFSRFFQLPQILVSVHQSPIQEYPQFARPSNSYLLRLLRIRSDAHMIDTDDIDHGSVIPRIVQRRIGQVRPDTNQAPGIGDHCGLLFTDEPWTHHLRHVRVAPQLRIKAGMGDDDRPGCDLERGFRAFEIGMNKDR